MRGARIFAPVRAHAGEIAGVSSVGSVCLLAAGMAPQREVRALAIVSELEGGGGIALALLKMRAVAFRMGGAYPSIYRYGVAFCRE